MLRVRITDSEYRELRKSFYKLWLVSSRKKEIDWEDALGNMIDEHPDYTLLQYQAVSKKYLNTKGQLL